jgi:A/G-specific adenine glycosylase
MTKAGFARALIHWYQKGHRELPWRETTDPYRIWLSEIMLQQTQVNTVLPYYSRYLDRFPTIASLAEADEQEVIKLWEGLGYYARCRNLHAAARRIVSEQGGHFPETLKEVQALPGIGRSTAGAILTFAFGQRHPLLDGNVKRVIARLYDIDEEVDRGAVQKRMWKYSEALLSEADDPAAFNQAVMELGATLCTRREPSCDRCPVEGHCYARARGTQSERPVKRPRKKSPHYNIAVGVIRDHGHILIQLRPPSGLLGGLWEFPGGKQEPDEALEEAVRREIQEELGVEVRVGALIAAVKHAYSHFRITLHAFDCELVSGTPVSHASQEWRWVAPEDLDQYAFPKANRTVLERIPK